MTSIYNPIQIHFTGQWYKSESINPTPNQEIHLLPVPNKIKRLFDFIGINSEIIGYLLHIDASNPLIHQFNTELLEDFGIKTRWSSNKEEIEEKTRSDSPEKLFLTPSQETEGYSLQIIPSGIYIQAVTLHGLFNAFQTFRQLLIGATNRNSRLKTEYLIPGIKIIDWPALVIRGVTDDITRGQIPTVDWIKQFIKKISQYKNNYFGLYIEDLFKCSKHPKIGEGRGAFTSEDLIELDRYANSRFVTLFPILECLGHMDNILILPEYRDLGEFPGTQCVAVSNGNIYSLFRDIINELSPCFSSKMFHMGCDEFFDFGHGQSQELIQIVGEDAALLRHIKKIYEIAKDNGFERILMYHDILIKYPQIRTELPKDIIIFYWDYGTKFRYPKVNQLLKAGYNVIVSGSMRCWCQHFPDYRNSTQINSQLFRIAKKGTDFLNIFQKSYPSSSAILGQMNSAWGDFSNHNLRRNNIYGAILSGSNSWMQKEKKYEYTIEEIGRTLFGLKDPNFVQDFSEYFVGLADMIKFYKNFFPILPPPFYTVLYRHPFRDYKPKPIIKSYKSILTTVKLLQRLWDSFSSKITRNLEYLPELRYSLDIIELVGLKEQLRVEVNRALQPFIREVTPIPLTIRENTIQIISSFITKAKSLYTTYEQLWLRCAKPPYFDFPLNRFRSMIHFCQEKIEQLKHGIGFVSPFLPARYIWTEERISFPKIRYFRREFNLNGIALSAKLQCIVANYGEIYVNGTYIGEILSRFSSSAIPLSQSVMVFDITPYLVKGKNIIGIVANQYLETYGFVNCYGEMKISCEGLQEQIVNIVSDKDWRFTRDSFDSPEWSTPDFPIDETHWLYVKDYGPSLGINFDLYTPKLLNGEKSLQEDYFGFINEIYYRVGFFISKSIARLLRRLVPQILHFFK